MTSLPEAGRSTDALLAEIAERRAADADWRGGRTFSLIYNSADHELEHMLEQVALVQLHENALNPTAFPSLARYESEVVAATTELLHAPVPAGSMTSGGTESILMSVKTHRDHARVTRGVTRGRIVTADTAHPAFAKAAHTLDLEAVRVPHGPDGRADVAALTDAITDDTVLVVGSAPCYPFGVVDDIPAIAAAASARGVGCHVDACLGGWLLPWWERLGHPVPPFDFRVPGVTAMSADIHKYGYMFKGASTVLYRDRDLLRHQYFLFDDWPGGLYGSPAAAGARPAAPLVGAWAVINHLGAEGYLAKAEVIWDTFRRLVDGIDAIDGLAVTGRPDFCAFEFAASPGSGVDVFGVGDVMDTHGWRLDRQNGGLHLMVSPFHAQVADQFLADLAAAVETHVASAGKAASYGGIAEA